MECKKCGKKVNKNDKFCGNCGVKIIRELDPKVAKFMKENLYKIILSSVLLIVLIFVYFIYTYINSASYVAKKYFKAITNNNAETIYNMLDLKDSTLMNVDLLKSKMKKYENVTDIEQVNEEIYNNEAVVTYQYSSNNNTNVGSVYMTKKDNKWIVKSGAIAYDVTITLPKDAQITLDGIDISTYKNSEKSNENVDVYTIDCMPAGKYKTVITLKDGTKVEDEAEITSNNTYRLGNITLKDDVTKKLNKTVKKLINNTYNGIINNTNNINYNEDINNYYKDLKYDFKISNFTLTGFNVKDLKILNTTDNDGKLQITYQVEYDYSIKYDNKDYSGTNRDIVTLVFNYDNYELSSIKNLDLRFPIRK